MSELKATPGPWFITTGERVLEICSIYVLPQDERTNGQGYANVGSEHCTFDREVNMANAHLIAAAPEMYFLLEMASCPIPQCIGGGYPDGRDGELVQCQWCYERKQILKKARGEA